MPYNKLFINLACSVCTDKYRTSALLYKPRPTGSVYTKKTLVRYFSVQTSRSVNKKLIICDGGTGRFCFKSSTAMLLFVSIWQPGTIQLIWTQYSHCMLITTQLWYICRFYNYASTGCIKKPEQIWICSQFCKTAIIIQFLMYIASLGTYNVE
jgi:hypothetical protein